MSAPLYERLGGYAGIEATVDDVMDRHLRNPVVGTRFQKIEDLDHAKRMATDFFAAGSGGPHEYTGKDMLAAHAGMGIDAGEFLAVVDDILAALDARGRDAATRDEVLGILYGLKDQIIEAR